MKRSVIIVAGGKGLRMGTDIPKQFLELSGRPIIVHTIGKFLSFDPDIEVVVVLPEDQQHRWTAIAQAFFPDQSLKVAHGGMTRFQSVKNGLKLTSGDIIGIHDAVRPLVSQEVIAKVYDQAIASKAVIPCVQVKDSIREVFKKNSRSVDRSRYVLIQTPQVFEARLLKSAYQLEESDQFTDDASVVEKYGGTISLAEGNDQNIKITTPGDLKIAYSFLSADDV